MEEKNGRKRLEEKEWKKKNGRKRMEEKEWKKKNGRKRMEKKEKVRKRTEERKRNYYLDRDPSKLWHRTHPKPPHA
jgi:hypothetical protein